MKKVIIAALSVGAMVLAGCTKTEVTDIPDSRYIGFDNAFIGNPTKAGLPVDDQFGAKNGISQFFVFGNTASEVVFDEVRVYESNDQWVYDELKQWANGQTYKFAAYSVTDANGLPEANGTAAFDYNNHQLTITDYTSNDTYQRDLLVATSAQTLNPDNEPVAFTFKHALSMIKFTFQSSLGDKNPITITNFKVAGINTKANLSVEEDAGTKIEWTGFSEESAFTDSRESMVATTTTPAVSEEFVVIPQSVTGNVTVTFHVEIVGLQGKDLTATIENPAWEYGKRYNYVATITGTDVDVIEFADPIVDDWTDDANSPISEDID